MPTPDPALPLLIDQQSELDHACEIIARHSQIALDTEFVRTNTYAPHLGLVQIAAGDSIFCVDPIAAINLDAFWELIFDPARTSLIHSGSQDMEVLWFTCGRVIPTLVDTQICAALLGHPAQIGYAGLAKELVNADIAKTQTRTDWSRRPLTAAQIEYAAEDVEHLPRMHELLQSQLEELSRYEWAIEDSLASTDAALYKPEPALAWQRLKSAPFLPPVQQARARALATWREARAVDSDKPRGWILSDKALLQLATDNPQQLSELSKIDDLLPGIARKQGKKLLTILATANNAFANGDIVIEQQQIDIDREKALSKKMSKVVRAEAEKLGIAAEVLASKRDIIAIIRGTGNSRALRGWRRSIVGEQLAELAN